MWSESDEMEIENLCSHDIVEYKVVEHPVEERVGTATNAIAKDVNGYPSPEGRIEEVDGLYDGVL